MHVCAPGRLDDDIWLDVEEQVVVVPAHLQQQGRLLLQRPLQVGGAGQQLTVHLDQDVAVFDASPVGDGGRGQSWRDRGGRTESTRRTYPQATGARLRARKPLC